MELLGWVATDVKSKIGAWKRSCHLVGDHRPHYSSKSFSLISSSAIKLNTFKYGTVDLAFVQRIGIMIWPVFQNWSGVFTVVIFLGPGNFTVGLVDRYAPWNLTDKHLILFSNRNRSQARSFSARRRTASTIPFTAAYVIFFFFEICIRHIDSAESRQKAVCLLHFQKKKTERKLTLSIPWLFRSEIRL